jgi:hypothetical protein
MMKKLSFLAALCLATGLFAQNSSSGCKLSKVYGLGYGAFGSLNDMYKHDGSYAQFRFGLGCDAYTHKKWAIAFEAAMQSGNTMRVDISPTMQQQAGGTTPQVVLEPFVDALVAVRYNFAGKFLLLAKGGIAYRQMSLNDRTSTADSLRRVNGEFQTGLGYNLNRRTRLVALYQGIYSGNLSLSLDSKNNVRLGHIPTLQNGLFGVEFQF